MKPIIAISTVILGSIFPVAAEVQKTETTTETSANADGSTTTTETKTTTFNPEARTKVVKYFETYKSDPYGLPPAYVTKTQVKEMPVTWRTTRLAPGVVVEEKERSYLVAAPPELIKILPSPTTGVRYYVAGSNVVAVDAKYRVVDSIQIPSVKFTEEP